jgi:CRP-like cAMP-binding protein
MYPGRIAHLRSGRGGVCAKQLRNGKKIRDRERRREQSNSASLAYAMSNDPKSVFDPKAFLAAVGAGVSVTKWNKGQVIFTQGDPADALFYIQKGKVKVTTLSRQGKEAAVAILGEGNARVAHV